MHSYVYNLFIFNESISLLRISCISLNAYLHFKIILFLRVNLGLLHNFCVEALNTFIRLFLGI